jgi:hypothetical protein
VTLKLKLTTSVKIRISIWIKILYVRIEGSGIGYLKNFIKILNTSKYSRRKKNTSTAGGVITDDETDVEIPVSVNSISI